MAKIRTLQILRGTTAQNDAYTGSAGELTMDTTTNELRLHDGSTAGGHVIGSGGGSGYHPDLFSVKWSDHQINDVQWLRGDTFSWQSGAVYQAAYQHLVDDIDGKSLQTETVAGTTISFYLADDGHKICPDTQESNVSAIFTATGVAWYYILDTVNQRFKLPRTQYGFTGLRDTVEKYVEAGLPNITGKIKVHQNQIQTPTGAFGIETGTVYTHYSASATGAENITFNAQGSNSIYGNSTTVQPPATQMYLYFYVGSFTQTAIENTAGLNASLFNGKADLDFGNTTMIDYVVEKQDPTALNNYTWYRKYKSGWVEQGGIKNQASSSAQALTLPVEMSGSTYSVLTSVMDDNLSGYVFCVKVTSKTTTGFNTTVWGSYQQGIAVSGYDFVWQVSGMAA